MPTLTVYLPDGLYHDVKQSDLPLSAICQKALREALAADDGGTPEGYWKSKYDSLYTEYRTLREDLEEIASTPTVVPAVQEKVKKPPVRRRITRTPVV